MRLCILGSAPCLSSSSASCGIGFNITAECSAVWTAMSLALARAPFSRKNFKIGLYALMAADFGPRAVFAQMQEPGW